MPPETLSIIVTVVALLAAAGCLAAAFSSFKRKRTIDDCPTSKTQGVFIGLTELKGTAESDEPLTSYLAASKCVQYTWKVDEHWSRTVHETYTDAQGHVHSRTRTESGWTNIAGDYKAIPFYLKDDAGIIRIVPDGAEIHDIKVFDKTCSPADDLYYGKCPAREIPHTTHKRRFYESAIPLHTMLYVIGQARERQDMVAAEIAHDKAVKMFIISNRTEKQVRSSYLRGFWLWLLAGLLCALGAAAAATYIGGYFLAFTWQPLLITAAAYVLVFILVWILNVYNSLINLHNRVKQGWSQVDVQLKRRYDLIPNLVKTVEGYRSHESDVQTLIAELRSQSQATPPGEKGDDFKGMAPLLNIISEKYPELKASQSFLRLQQQLSETEQRIALARDYYNDIATFYNTRLEIIPDRFVAFIARLRPRSLMGAADFERAPVQVKLAA
jgi:hypothetical protein